jgi:hypothetical protein
MPNRCQIDAKRQIDGSAKIDAIAKSMRNWDLDKIDDVLKIYLCLDCTCRKLWFLMNGCRQNDNIHAYTEQNSFPHLRVLLALVTDRGIFSPCQTSVVDGRICPLLGGPLRRTLSLLKNKRRYEIPAFTKRLRKHTLNVSTIWTNCLNTDRLNTHK